ncbi:Uncharacterised protein [Mycobacteroides abscessus subsp. abscessus]|nr:Uncharacterised protein [Mycobacteroides abscessus subsp. abscessus]
MRKSEIASPLACSGASSEYSNSPLRKYAWRSTAASHWLLAPAVTSSAVCCTLGGRLAGTSSSVSNWLEFTGVAVLRSSTSGVIERYSIEYC